MKSGINFTHTESENPMNKPLGFAGKLWCFAFPGIIKLYYSGKLRAGGYEKKADEIRAWTVYGFEFYILIFLIFILYKSL